MLPVTITVPPRSTYQCSDKESIFSCLRQFFQAAVSSPPAGIAHSPQVSTGMNVWGIMDIKSCVLGEWCLEDVGIVVGLTHEKCGMATLVSGCLRGERQEIILLVELLNFVCHDEWCTEQTYVCLSLVYVANLICY